MGGSSGKNVKKGRLSKEQRREISLKNLKKTRNKRSKVDWVRLEKYKANRLSGMNRFQSALKAGYSYTTARHCSNKYDRLAKIDIQQALEDEGATCRVQARELVNMALNATKRQKCTVEIRQEDGEVVVDDQAAEIVPDYSERRQNWELIARLKGQLRPASILPDSGYKRLVIVVEKEADSDSNQGPRGTDQVDQPTRLRVETADE